MPLKSSIAVAGLAALLAACGSPTTASNATFTQAINNHFAKNCIAIDLARFVNARDSDYVKGYPVSISQAVDYSSAPSNTLRESFDALVTAGALTETDGTTMRPGHFGGDADTKVPARIYSLTAKGKAALKDKDGSGLALCIGNLKVDKIVRFTQPTPDNGTTISRVMFTAHAVNVPDWARSDAITKTYPRYAKAIAPESSDFDATMVLTSDGWIDARDFK